ncbi:alkaline phosphatase family protein [Novosphingobium sp.]|uniref:alkaline phosphatase family protein n=1 Tax=Novosphingobium sp. TaxID=1874826 RepID=UPI0022BEDB10|nr:alkaline phosphatase family protein [Novosphingobium sp.]MCZ8018093.1 alkaline phosphatase family protein [Novosphingobium sp.]MCZ8034412.1 alkaline phosphatase family protein [Novosphingobium sp.]MCZ8052380.1 alkaline phosphatase family protein [Novosphingobium sp.]MCZ8061245.1 alkaline phosphatase family protein [Novosphingobium sp.]MCZ8232876.1 alkaline phosphatase family protein [Novosphingobium sp.]
MRRTFASLLATAALGLAIVAPAQAQEAAPAAAATAPAQVDRPGPQLVLAVSIDQLSSDLFAQYREHFTDGFARLLGGAVFPSGYQSHAATETCPGHSTILTGVRPARNGIIANNWFDPRIARADKKIYCSEDLSDPASTSREPVVSANLLKVPTLGEMMKRANPATRNVAVSAKDRAVVMMGGHQIDAGYWWKGSGFTTFKGRELSPAAQRANAAAAALLAKGAPALKVPVWCGARDRAVAIGNGSVGTFRFALPKGAKPDMLRVSPRMDGATVDLALGLVDQLKLGQGAVPDVLSVSLSASDYIGHAVGTEGVEMCIQLAELDRNLGRLFTALDARKIDYMVVLTADHGGHDAPERLRQQALPGAARADKALMPAALGVEITRRTGIAAPQGPLIYGDGPFGDMYVNAAITGEAKAKVVRELVNLTRYHPQVAAVYTAADLAATPMPTGNPQDWTIRERARASFMAERSGDVVVLLDRAITPIPEPMPGAYVATHGSVWDYDRRVPILFWRKGMAGFEQPNPIETVDIAPTLAAQLGLKVSDGVFDGRCLDLDAGAGNSCERVK